MHHKISLTGLRWSVQNTPESQQLWGFKQGVRRMDLLFSDTEVLESDSTQSAIKLNKWCLRCAIDINPAVFIFCILISMGGPAKVNMFSLGWSAADSFQHVHLFSVSSEQISRGSTRGRGECVWEEHSGVTGEHNLHLRDTDRHITALQMFIQWLTPSESFTIDYCWLLVRLPKHADEGDDMMSDGGG